MPRSTPDSVCFTRSSGTGLSPSPAGFPKTVLLTKASACDSPLPRRQKPAVWALPISLAATFGIDLSFFSSAYLDVSVQRVPSAYLWIQHAVTEVRSAGFPHSEIRGSPDICSSPRLIAACHVFLRRSVPRHPPCALCHLTFWFSHSLSEVSPAAVRVASQPAAIIS